VDKIKLGNSGIEVSQICLGTMYFGTKVDPKMSYSMLDQYFESGGRFLDSANKYACWIEGFKGGDSEMIIGKWMRERQNRKEMFVATKLGFDHPPDVSAGLKASQIEEECEKSLMRMKTDVIDLYYAHCDDRDTPMEETLEAFNRLVQAGKVRYIGASNFMTWRLEEAHWISKNNGWESYQCIQQAHTYIRPMPGGWNPGRESGKELFDYCRTRNITLLAYCPLRQGAYTRNDRPIPWPGPDTDVRLKILERIADKKEATHNQIILAWMMQSNPQVIPVMAASNPDQMKENLNAINFKLQNEDMEQLDKAAF
jgi:aryl-alcohol dehydrogenase-like predicted oxidoreductase